MMYFTSRTEKLKPKPKTAKGGVPQRKHPKSAYKFPFMEHQHKHILAHHQKECAAAGTDKNGSMTNNQRLLHIPKFEQMETNGQVSDRFSSNSKKSAKRSNQRSGFSGLGQAVANNQGEKRKYHDAQVSLVGSGYDNKDNNKEDNNTVRNPVTMAENFENKKRSIPSPPPVFFSPSLSPEGNAPFTNVPASVLEERRRLGGLSRGLHTDSSFLPAAYSNMDRLFEDNAIESLVAESARFGGPGSLALILRQSRLGLLPGMQATSPIPLHAAAIHPYNVIPPVATSIIPGMQRHHSVEVGLGDVGALYSRMLANQEALSEVAAQRAQENLHCSMHRNSADGPKTAPSQKNELCTAPTNTRVKLSPAKEEVIPCEVTSDSIALSRETNVVSPSNTGMESCSQGKASLAHDRSLHEPLRKKCKAQVEIQEPTLRKPKQPLSAYNFFFKHERALIINGRSDSGNDVFSGVSRSTADGTKKRPHRKTHGKIGFKELGKQIGQKWKTLDPKSKACFEAAAAREQARYKKELADFKRMKELIGNQILIDEGKGKTY